MLMVAADEGEEPLDLTSSAVAAPAAPSPTAIQMAFEEWCSRSMEYGRVWLR